MKSQARASGVGQRLARPAPAIQSKYPPCGEGACRLQPEGSGGCTQTWTRDCGSSWWDFDCSLAAQRGCAREVVEPAKSLGTKGASGWGGEGLNGSTLRIDSALAALNAGKEAIMPWKTKCGCPEQYHGRWCPACHGTGEIPPAPHAPMPECPDRCRPGKEAESPPVSYHVCLACGLTTQSGPCEHCGASAVLTVRKP